MASQTLSIERCPRCQSTDKVKGKLLLLNKGTLSQASSRFRPECACDGGFTVQSLKPEFLSLVSDEQFIHGLYCEACGIGFIADAVAKPRAPAYKLFSDGWRRVLPDGTLGPVLERIADDPDSSVL